MEHSPSHRSTGYDITAPTLGAASPTGQNRLADGQLTPLVLHHLHAHPDLDFSPYELAKVLHRSHGTVRRHLLRLAAAGVVTRTRVKPARFQITI